MKKIVLVLCSALLVFASKAQLTTPQPSPSQTLKQNFGLSAIELSYSRPGIKGRKVFGDLVPFGKVWRTGANNATILTFGEEVTIGGKKIPAGKYGLLSIPDKDNWTFIITKQLDVTSPAAYTQESDVVRVVAKPQTLANKIETFTIQFAEVKNTSCEIQVMWENTLATLPVSTDVETKVMAQIDQLMNQDNRPYFNAAMYYLETGKDLNKALVWFDKAAEQQPDAFWIHHQRANCLAKLGRKKEAKDAAEKSKALATAQKNDDYVKLNNDLIRTL